MSGKKHRHTLIEWFDLHDISTSVLPFWLEVISSSVNYGDFQQAIDESDISQMTFPNKMSGKTVWQLAADALLQLWPEQKQLITTTAKSTVVHFHVEVEQPRTIDNGPDAPPEVYINYQKRIEDILAVAHEFGHALQIVANQSRFTPPILRELAAFISELALLHHIKQQQTSIIPVPSAGLATGQFALPKARYG